MSEIAERTDITEVFTQLCGPCIADYNSHVEMVPNDQFSAIQGLDSPTIKDATGMYITADENLRSITLISDDGYNFLTTCLMITRTGVSLIQSKGKILYRENGRNFIPKSGTVLLPNSGINPSLVKALIERCSKNS